MEMYLSVFIYLWMWESLSLVYKLKLTLRLKVRMRSLVLGICRSDGKKRRTSGILMQQMISDLPQYLCDIILISCSYLCKTWRVLVQFLCESEAAADGEDSVTESGLLQTVLALVSSRFNCSERCVSVQRCSDRHGWCLQTLSLL